jgi:replication factor A1
LSDFEELLSKLLEKIPELSRSVIEERIKEKKDKIGSGYLTDQGALFLVASDLGVSLEDSQKTEIELKDLFVGAKEVTLESRVLNMSPAKQFIKKDGTPFFLRTMTVYDSNSVVSVKLWDEKATLPDIENLKPGDLVKIIKAYVKSDLTGAPTINIGSGGTIEPKKSNSNIPLINSITIDASKIKEAQKDLVVTGKINGVINLLEFTNSKGRPSTALKFRLSGENDKLVNVVLWGKDESILPKMVLPNAGVKLYGVRTKIGNQGLEIHGNDATIIEIEGKQEIEPVIVRLLSVVKLDSGEITALGIDKSKKMIQINDVSGSIGSFDLNSILECMPSKIFGNIIKIDHDSFVRKIDDDSLPNISELRTKISEIKEGSGHCVEAIILKAPERRELQTKNGETVSLSEMFVEDDSAQIWIKAWRKQADLLSNFTLGDIITVLGVNAKPGLEGRIELVLTSYSKIIKKN